MARKNHQPATQVLIPFQVGQQVAFIYNGGIRVGRVEKVTPRVVTLSDNVRNAFRSFSIAKINRA